MGPFICILSFGKSVVAEYTMVSEIEVEFFTMTLVLLQCNVVFVEKKSTKLARSNGEVLSNAELHPYSPREENPRSVRPSLNRCTLN